MAPSTLEPRMLNITSLKIGANLGNWYASSANYTCSPISFSWKSAVAPLEISIVNGSEASLPANLLGFSDALPDFQILERLPTNFTASYGDSTWSLGSNYPPGSQLALLARDGANNVAVSEIRQIYQGGKGNSACQNVVAEPDQPQGLGFSTRAGNWYRPSTVYPCTPVTVNYYDISPPATLELYNASTSLNPSPALFQSAGTRHLADLNIIQTIATLNSSSGSYDWVIPSDFPLGARVGLRLKDSTGNTAVSEARLIYPSSFNTMDLCKASSSTSSSTNADQFKRPIVQFGLFLAAAIGLIFLVLLTICCCRRCKRVEREAHRNAQPSGEAGTFSSAPFIGSIGSPQTAGNAPGSNAPQTSFSNDVALQTYRPRQESEEDLPPYSPPAAPKAA